MWIVTDYGRLVNLDNIESLQVQEGALLVFSAGTEGYFKVVDDKDCGPGASKEILDDITEMLNEAEIVLDYKDYQATNIRNVEEKV